MGRRRAFMHAPGAGPGANEAMVHRRAAVSPAALAPVAVGAPAGAKRALGRSHARRNLRRRIRACRRSYMNRRGSGREVGIGPAACGHGCTRRGFGRKRGDGSSTRGRVARSAAACTCSSAGRREAGARTVPRASQSPPPHSRLPALLHEPARVRARGGVGPAACGHGCTRRGFGRGVGVGPAVCTHACTRRGLRRCRADAGGGRRSACCGARRRSAPGRGRRGGSRAGGR